MKYKVFIGIDVSKKTLDFTVLINGEKVLYKQVKNTKAGIAGFYKLLEPLLAKSALSVSACLYCLEHTGIYTQPFLDYAKEQAWDVWLEDASKIRSFYGMSREKNDAIDSLMIAEYGYMKREKARLWQAPRAIMVTLKHLLSARQRLIDGRTRLVVPTKEGEDFLTKEDVESLKQSMQPIVDQINKEIKELEKKIRKLIKSDQHLDDCYTQMTSVRGVGFVIATYTLVVTNEFKTISKPKKMACHSGVAPFKRQSGTSLKGKAKVSHRANKGMKTLLNLGARSAVRHPGELRDYYLRKIDEGKNKMAVLNAVRNKLIHRMFACVREQREYQQTAPHTRAA